MDDVRAAWRNAVTPWALQPPHLWMRRIARGLVSGGLKGCAYFMRSRNCRAVEDLSPRQNPHLLQLEKSYSPAGRVALCLESIL